MRRSPFLTTLAVSGALAAAATAGTPADKPPADKPAADKPAAAAAVVAEQIAIGATAPAFELVGTDDRKHTLAEALDLGAGKTARAVVVVFTCNACPYAKAYEPVLIDMAKRYADRGVRFVAINPNDPKIVADDSFDKMKERAKEKGYPFPYLFDATQETAKAYGAARTPHVFLVDSKQIVRYRGRISDHQDRAKETTQDLASAIEAVLAGKDIAVADTKALGCSIKWKKAS